MTARCDAAIDLSTLVDYWTGELGEREAALEEHLFGCAGCTERLRFVAALGESVAALAAGGEIFASLTGRLLDRAAADGLRIRTYRLRPDESVACTIGPHDDANAVRLRADFTGAERVDLDVYAVDNGREERTEHLEDVAVDRETSEVVLLYPGDAIRPLPKSTFVLRLSAHATGATTPLGTYTLNHAPWEQADASARTPP